MTEPPEARLAWEWLATGTRWRIYHAGTLTSAVAASVCELVEQDERRWSRFRPDSEVAQLNRTPGRWVSVSTQTLALLDVCNGWTERTGGVFQPLIGGAIDAWGYRHSFSEQQPFSAFAPTPTPIGGAIRIDLGRGRAKLPAGSAIDLGGIGKSWIAARAAALLSSLSDDPALLLDAGGDLLAVGGAHVVAVEVANEPDRGTLTWIRLTEGQASATSGFGRRQWVNGDGSASHHLIDPSTGAPGPLVHATVVSDDVVEADVNAKVLALRPDRVSECPLAALIQLTGGSVTSPSWHEVLADERADAEATRAADRPLVAAGDRAVAGAQRR